MAGSSASRTFPFIRSTAAACAAGATVSLALTAGVSAQPVELPSIVVYANQAPLESDRIGASVTVISGEDLRRKGVTTVAEALRSVPGVAISQAGTRGSLVEARMRGGETNQVLVLVDGIEINGLGDPIFNFADFPVDDIARIEVIRGPQSGLYGSNANTGVISITTLSGKGLGRPRVEARIEGGTRDTLAGSANARGAAGPFYGSFSVSDYSTAGYNISRFGSEADGSRALTVTGKGGVDLTPYLNIEGVLRYTNRSADDDPQDFNFPFGPFYGFVVDGNNRTTYEGLAGRVGATLTLLDGRWIQSVNVKRFDETTRGFANNVVAFGGDGSRTTLDYKSTVLFDTAVMGGERHSVSVLVDKRREDFEQLCTFPPFCNPLYRKTRTGLAGEYVLDLPTHTTLSGALRQDFNSAFTDILTWRLALSQRFPTTGTRIHASHGKGVTDPTVFELFGSTFNLPNPGIIPEQSIGWDVGVEQSLWNGRARVDVTYFSSDFTDKIELTTTPAGFIYVNGPGVARRRGVEVAAGARLTDWLTASTSYTYTDAVDSLGLAEVRRPPHSGSVEATARFADNRASATIGAVFNGTRKDFFFAPTGTQRVDLPGATVVRAMLSYDVTQWATAYVRAENVFDARYEDVFSYRAPPFMAVAGLRVRFD